jgi:hypothetical protein
MITTLCRQVTQKASMPAGAVFQRTNTMFRGVSAGSSHELVTRSICFQFAAMRFQVL